MAYAATHYNKKAAGCIGGQDRSAMAARPQFTHGLRRDFYAACLVRTKISYTMLYIENVLQCALHTNLR